MKRARAATFASVAALLTLPATAAGNITVPAVGGSVTGIGNITMRGTIFSISCAANIGARVLSPTHLSISPVSISACGSGATAVALGLPWSLSLVLSPRAFTITGVQVNVDNPFEVCLYSGSVSGTYTVGANSRLTITADSLTFVRGSSICSSNPSLTGYLQTNMTTT